MKISFSKNCSKNYMCIEEFENYNFCNDYMLQMLKNNSLKHTLDFSYDIVNNDVIFKYDITSKQAMSSLFNINPINYNAFSTIMISLMEVVSVLEEYLIDIRSLVLVPEYIFIDPEKYTTSFAICPGWQQDFYESLNAFIDKLLKQIDHSDDSLVLLAYKISYDISKPGYNISSLRGSLYDSRLSPNDKPLNNKNISENKQSSDQKESFIINQYAKEQDISRDLSKGTEVTKQKESTKNSIFLAKTEYSENDSNPHKLSDNSLKMLIKSRLFHNEKGLYADLYTISKGFYAKIIVLSSIVLLFLGSSFITYIYELTSYHTSLLLLIIGIAFLFGSIRYLLELYPSAKIPHFKGISALPITSGEESAKSETAKPKFEPTPEAKLAHKSAPTPEHKPLPTLESHINSYTLSDVPEGDYGETVLLSVPTNNNNHRLVYMGTDYSDDVTINTYPFTIGKLKTSVNLFINNPLISRLHASIQIDNGNIIIEDLNSSNGTYLNGKLLAPHQRTTLNSGDTITFSHLTYMFK